MESDYGVIPLPPGCRFAAGAIKEWFNNIGKLFGPVLLICSLNCHENRETNSYYTMVAKANLQNIKIYVCNGQTQRPIVQCDIQEGLDFSITYHLTINAVRIITNTFTWFQIFMSSRHRYTARDKT